jgi:hypothetical protein
MAFTDMNDVDQDLGEEKPADRNGNRSFMVIAGIMGGVMVLALLCIAALAIFRYLPGQRAAQIANATNEAQATAVALAGSQTAEPLAPTRTMPPTALPPTVLPPTHTPLPTHTQVSIAAPTQTPAIDVAMATVYAMRTQRALNSPTPAQPTQVEATPAQPTSAQPTQIPPTSTPPVVAQATPTRSPVAPPATGAPTTRPSATALPQTGLAEELGTTGLMTAAFFLVVIIFLMRRLRTAP